MVFTKNGLSGLSPDYCHEFNDMNELNDRKDVVHAYVMY